MNISSAIDIQLDHEVNRIKGLSDWHLYTKTCADGRINNAYDLWNTWIQNAVSSLERCKFEINTSFKGQEWEH